MNRQDLNKYMLRYHDWHIHTFYTDGKNSVSEIVKEAKLKSLHSIAITEHVRKELTYDFNLLMNQIKLSEKKYNITVFVGCEAKVIDNSGNLDVSQETLQKCDLVLGAFHQFPNNKIKYFNAILAMLGNPIVNIWAHPLRFAHLNNIIFSDSELLCIFKAVKENNVIYEINSVFPPTDRQVRLINSYKIGYCFGSDSHDKTNLLSPDFYQIWIKKLWNKKFQTNCLPSDSF